MLPFAEHERGCNCGTTQTGRAIARQDPDYREDRLKIVSRSQIDHALSLLEEGKTYRQVEELTGISKSTVIRAKQKRSVDCQINQRSFLFLLLHRQRNRLAVGQELGRFSI